LNNGAFTQTSSVYARSFQGGDAVARYFRKLDNRIDRLRDALEAEILGSRLYGRLFDCTVGVGRFVDRLPAVTSYSGVDFSSEFVSFVQERYPHVQAEVADLTRGIQQPDACFDSVLCLRSLSAIGHVDGILREMVRIARPGGVIAFDYGRKPRRSFRMRGEQVSIDAEDIEPVLRTLDADVAERVRVDGILARLKARTRIFRLLNGPGGRWVPDGILGTTERALTPFLWQREIIFLRKRGRPA
jgi:SAM-dependent methyltransferase